MKAFRLPYRSKTQILSLLLLTIILVIGAAVMQRGLVVWDFNLESSSRSVPGGFSDIQQMPAASFSRQGATLTGVSNKSISESSITSLESSLASIEVPDVEASPISTTLLVSFDAGQDLNQESAPGVVQNIEGQVSESPVLGEDIQEKSESNAKEQDTHSSLEATDLPHQQDHTEELEQGARSTPPNRCQALSSLSSKPFFSHCSVPNHIGVKAIEAYVDQRLTTYVGNPDCWEELTEFHCLEYAARQKGWCDWALAPAVEPPASEDFLVKPSRTFDSGSVEASSLEDQRLIFYYPSYAFLSMLEKSITALQHPNHVFLISVDEAEYADPFFVSGARELATSLNEVYYDNVFLIQQGRVLYERSTQILIAWPFMAWSLGQVKCWTHFILLGAQTYPLVSNEKLREVLWERRDKIFFTKTPYEVSTGPGFEGGMTFQRCHCCYIGCVSDVPALRRCSE